MSPPHSIGLRRPVICAFALAALAAPVAAAPGALSAGAGRAAIEIPVSALPMEGFGVPHDPLEARVLVLGAGPERAAIAVIDMTSIGEDTVGRLQSLISGATGVPAANIFVCASHTFSAPHLLPAGRGPAGSAEDDAKAAAYRASLEAAVSKAATEAAQHVEPATLGYGLGASNVNVNRNVPTAQGWWLGANEHGPSDRSVAVIRIDGSDHQPIAVLVNYAVQSAIMDHSNVGEGQKAITADLAGAAVRHVEREYGGRTVSMFLIGAAGDQAPAYSAIRNVATKDGGQRTVDIGKDAFPLVDLLGERLGSEAVHVNQAIVAQGSPSTLRVRSGSVELPTQARPRNLQDLHPAKSYDFQVAGQSRAPFFVMQIGDVALVGVQAELSSVTGEDIKARSPFRRTVVMTMVNGAAKYMPEAESYDHITYEAMNSAYARGSAETFADAILKTLAAMHADGPR